MSEVTDNTSSARTKANYSYSSDGAKLKVRGAQGEGYDYIGSMTLERGAGGSLNGMEALFAGGQFKDGEVMFFETDHLGSVRSVINDLGEAVATNDYYPFGTRHSGSDIEVDDNFRYRFNGKEEQLTGNLGLLDYGARMYDAEIGRWFVPDPLAEIYPFISPYVYCLNNPVKLIDPDGMKVLNGDEEEYEKAKREAEEARNKFNEVWSSFGENSKEVKSAQRILNKAERALKNAQSKYENTQKHIDDFKDVDEEHFNILDNLTYVDGSGKTQTLDVYVSSGTLETGIKNGQTKYIFREKTGIIENMYGIKHAVSVTLAQPTLLGTLAHEGGHTAALAANPAGYHNAIRTAGEGFNCQDLKNRDHAVSKMALEWQFRYKQRKQQQKPKP